MTTATTQAREATDTGRHSAGWLLPYIFFALIAVTPAVTYVRIGSTGASTSDIPQLLACLVGAVAVLRDRPGLRPWPRSLVPLVALVAVAGASAVNAGGRKHDLLTGPGRWSEITVLVFLAWLLARDDRVRTFAVRAVVLVAVAEALFGFGAFAAHWVGPANLGVDRIGIQPFRSYQSLYKVLPGRISGTTGLSTEAVAALFALALPMAVGLALGQRARQRLVWAGAAAIIAAGLLLTFTRTAIVIGLLVTVVLLAVRTRPLVTLGSVAAIAVAVLTTPVRSRFLEDSNDRIKLWIAAWHMIRAHPALGVGPDEYLRYLPRYAHTSRGVAGSTAHNFVLEAAATMGVVAGLLILAAVVSSLTWIRAAWERRAPRPELLGAWLALVGFALISLTVNLFFWPQVAVVFWVLANGLGRVGTDPRPAPAVAAG